MFIHCELRLSYSSLDTADKIKRSLDVDNQNFIETQLSSNSIIAQIETKSCMSLLHTLEDYLACLSTAENLLE
jgi:hypothetical protein